MNINTPAGQPTVYYDGACPLCRREIAFYRQQRGAEKVAWVDVAEKDAVLPDGLTTERALARFHITTEIGELKSGGEAFAFLWTRFPAFRWAGHMASLPLIAWGLERLYRVLLRFRPRMQRLFS